MSSHRAYIIFEEEEVNIQISTHIYTMSGVQKCLGGRGRKPGKATEKAGEEGAISLRLLSKVSFKKVSLELRFVESEA